MFGIGTPELIIVGILAIILFGNRLPSVARSLGKSLNEFKRGVREFEEEVKTSVYSEPTGRVSYDEKVERPATNCEAEAEAKTEVQHQ